MLSLTERMRILTATRFLKIAFQIPNYQGPYFRLSLRPRLALGVLPELEVAHDVSVKLLYEVRNFCGLLLHRSVP